MIRHLLSGVSVFVVVAIRDSVAAGPVSRFGSLGVFQSVRLSF